MNFRMKVAGVESGRYKTLNDVYVALRDEINKQKGLGTADCIDRYQTQSRPGRVVGIPDVDPVTGEQIVKMNYAVIFPYGPNDVVMVRPISPEAEQEITPELMMKIQKELGLTPTV